MLGRPAIGRPPLAAFVRVATLAVAITAGVARADELKGFVRDGTGTPVVNADFDVFDADGNKLPASDNTDATGKYRLTLDPGRYDVVVQPPINSGFAPVVRAGVLVSGSTLLDWVVPPSVRVLGRVTDLAGGGVSGADLDFDDATLGDRRPALGDITSPFGTFAAYVEQGRYDVTANPPPGSTLAPIRIWNRLLTGADTLAFVLPIARWLTGRVRDPGGASVSGARLTFDRIDDGRRQPSVDNRTLADGTFRAGVQAGTYRVTVQPPRSSRWVAKRFDAIDLSGDSSRNVDFESGWLVSGTVTDSNRAPIANASWLATSLGDGSTVPTPNDNTTADGHYQIVLPTGSYRLQLIPPRGSTLDTLTFEPIAVGRDTTFDASWASGPPPAVRSIRLAALRNPTYREARFRLSVPTTGTVRVELFDVTGRLVAVVADRVFAAGVHDLAWDGTRSSGARAHSGVFFVRASAGSAHQVTRFVLLPRPPI